MLVFCNGEERFMTPKRVIYLLLVRYSSFALVPPFMESRTLHVASGEVHGHGDKV